MKTEQTTESKIAGARKPGRFRGWAHQLREKMSEWRHKKTAH